MDEHELELHAKFALPEFGGFAAGIEARYKRSWGQRGNELIEVVQTEAGISPEALGKRLEEDERVRDAFMRGGQRAIEVGDPEYRAVLGRIIAAAFDDAKIDEAEYLLAQLIKLEPIHVRTLVAVFDFYRSDDGKFVSVPPDEATHLRPSAINAAGLGEQLGVSTSLAGSTLDVLTAAGLLEELPDDRPMTYGRMKTSHILRTRSWRPTPWGKSALLGIFHDMQDLPV